MIAKPHTFRLSLPGEIMAFAWLCVMAISGGLMTQSRFYQSLSNIGESGQWFAIVWTIGVAGMATCATEAAFGRCWGAAWLKWCVFARLWLNLTGIAAWVYMTHTVFDAGIGWRTPAIPFGLLIFGLFHLWTAIMCKRAYYILRPDTKTTELEARLEAGRLQRMF